MLHFAPNGGPLGPGSIDSAAKTSTLVGNALLSATRKRTKVGTCHICGVYGPRSFEHVPPYAAFNNHPIVELSGEKLLHVHPDELRNKRGPVSQRGAGGYTLCKSCNNLTGTWYGTAFAQWAHEGLYLLEHAKVAPSFYHTFHIFPLRVIKQVFCMFFSANPPGFAQVNQDLVRFVLNRDFRFANPALRIFLYFNGGAVSRQSAMTGRLDFALSSSDVYSEITFPPFGYILVPGGQPAPDKRLVEITHFSHYSYSQWVDVSLRVPVFDIYTAYPADFRSRTEVLAESEERQTGDAS